MLEDSNLEILVCFDFLFNLWISWVTVRFTRLGSCVIGCYLLLVQICTTDAVADMEEDLKVLMKADPDQQETLQTEVFPDPMEGEQTWPTEEELDEANGQWQQTCQQFFTWSLLA